MSLTRLLWTLLVLVALVPVVLMVLLERVPPEKIGVKQIRWAQGGFVQRDYDVGYHLGITGYHLWHFLPRQTHFVHFTEERVRRDGVADYDRPIDLRTKDNNKISVEISIPFRIKEGEGHLILREGMRVDYFNRAKQTMASHIRSGLAALTSEDMQDPAKRTARTAALLPIMNEELARYHVVADALLVRRFEFLPEYEEQLQEKQFLRQKAYLDDALTAQANEEKTVNTIERQIVAAEKELEQDWEKRLQEKRSEYQVRIAEIDAEGKVYASRTRAEGDAQLVILGAKGKLALEQAEALRNELRTEALNSKGGGILLALEAAQNLSVPRVTLNADDPAVPMLLDLGAVTRLLVGEIGSAGGAGDDHAARATGGASGGGGD